MKPLSLSATLGLSALLSLDAYAGVTVRQLSQASSKLFGEQALESGRKSQDPGRGTGPRTLGQPSFERAPSSSFAHGLHDAVEAVEYAPSLSRAANHLPAMRSVYMLKKTPKDLELSAPGSVVNDILNVAAERCTGFSMRYVLDYGSQPKHLQMLHSARFLHQELPVRLAHRILDLDNLPKALANSVHVKRVKCWYADSFAELRRFPPVQSEKDVANFTQMLKSAYQERHAYVVPAIAKGVEEYRRLPQSQTENAPGKADSYSRKQDHDLQHFLDNFFLSRIALRFLAGHHIALFDQVHGRDGGKFCPPNVIGLIDLKCSPYKICGKAPEVVLHGNPSLTLAFHPSHLNFMVFELVKNSLRATQEKYDNADYVPPVTVVIADGEEDITIKVSDEGGGIPRSDLSRIFTYLYTTAKSPLPEVGSDYTSLPAVLAGYGCGLPLSRLHAKYFGGDLQIFSMEGYGTDAYLHLLRLGSDEELLPE